MKQLHFLIFILFSITATCRAQDSLHMITPKSSAEKNKYYIPQQNSKEYYLEKRNKLNTAGWVLMGGGLTMGVIGTVMYINADHGNDWNETGNALSGVFLMTIGSAMVITSVPIFIRAGYYKRKALDMSASLQFEHYQSGLAMKSYPAIGLRISL